MIGLARFALPLCLMLPLPAMASSTTTYSYDALGRLVKSETAGTVNNGAKVEIAYDPADNRTNYKVSGVRAKAVVVVPINGLTVIPIKDD